MLLPLETSLEGKIQAHQDAKGLAGAVAQPAGVPLEVVLEALGSRRRGRLRSAQSQLIGQTETGRLNKALKNVKL